MKKLICMLLAGSMLLALCACGETKLSIQQEEPQEQTGLSEDAFLEKLQGYWLTKMDDSCYLLNFEEDQYLRGYFESTADSSGTITNIEKKDETQFVVTIHCPELEFFEGTVPERDEVFTFTSEDGFENTMTVNFELGEFEFTGTGPDYLDVQELYYNWMS